MPSFHASSAALLLICLGASFPAAAQPGLVSSEFIYETAPFPSCHASTIVQTPSGLVAAWFGGTREGHASVGIWLSRHDGKSWSAPVEVANGIESPEKRYPCWNPVLFRPAIGPLMLFYKVGPSPSKWWGMLMTSADDGRTWGKPSRLPEGILGPIKNKPVQLADGATLCPTSSEHAGWRVHFERTADLGKTWQAALVLESEPGEYSYPAVIQSADGLVHITYTWKRQRIKHAVVDVNKLQLKPIKDGRWPE